MLNHSYLSNADIDSVEELYQNYLQNPDSVDDSWKRFFEGFDLAYGKLGLNGSSVSVSEDMMKEINVLHLINNGYRTRGHFFTKTNPVRARRTYTPDLNISNFGLESADLEKTFNAGVEIGIGPAKLKDIIAHLDQTYCPPVLCSNGWSTVDSVVTCRSKQVEAGPGLPLPPGRPLIYHPNAQLSDGAAQAASRGFFDVDNAPPWATWVGYFQDDTGDYGPYLLSWVPVAAIPLAQAGIDVNPEQGVEAPAGMGSASRRGAERRLGACSRGQAAAAN
jgi:hypothetical protein